MWCSTILKSSNAPISMLGELRAGKHQSKVNFKQNFTNIVDKGVHTPLF